MLNLVCACELKCGACRTWKYFVDTLLDYDRISLVFW